MKDSSVLVITVAASVASVVKCVKVHRIEKIKRQKIEENLQHELAAIRLAGARTLDRINNEPLQSLATYMNDFEFQLIIARNGE